MSLRNAAMCPSNTTVTSGRPRVSDGMVPSAVWLRRGRGGTCGSLTTLPFCAHTSQCY